jgi:hypothetical protein
MNEPPAPLVAFLLRFRELERANSAQDVGSTPDQIAIPTHLVGLNAAGLREVARPLRAHRD